MREFEKVAYNLFSIHNQEPITQSMQLPLILYSCIAIFISRFLDMPFLQKLLWRTGDTCIVQNGSQATLHSYAILFSQKSLKKVPRMLPPYLFPIWASSPSYVLTVCHTITCDWLPRICIQCTEWTLSVSYDWSLFKDLL